MESTIAARPVERDTVDADGLRMEHVVQAQPVSRVKTHRIRVENIDDRLTLGAVAGHPL